MKNGIGPQNLGAAGMSGNSKPCGSPLKKLPDLSGDGKVTQKDVLIGRGVIDGLQTGKSACGASLDEVRQ